MIKTNLIWLKKHKYDMDIKLNFDNIEFKNCVQNHQSWLNMATTSFTWPKWHKIVLGIKLIQFNSWFYKLYLNDQNIRNMTQI